ncbi:hypothetical protein Glove_73g32 [Diversispora epigaea]|uniref:ABC transmembrane type-1 domain-containing protein n=1 Tax=Diversispora epigaea TaxID=1348612 RepID=A0A397JAI1_9GLOM|nr:hypothetical protein Glove_73g32 [Diversispora epigaea]
MGCLVYTDGRISRKIREKYLRAILRQNIAYFDKIGASEVTARITHLIQDGISEKFAMLYFCQFVIAFVIAFTKNWKMTFVICCLIPLVSITSGIVNKLTAVFMRRSSDFYILAFGTQKKISKLCDYHIKAVEGRKKSIASGAEVAFWYGTNLVLDASAKFFETIYRVPLIDIESEEGEKIKVKEAEENSDLLNSSMIPPEDKVIKNKQDIILEEEDHHLGRVITNLSASSAILSERKADLEAGMKLKHDYEYTT